MRRYLFPFSLGFFSAGFQVILLRRLFSAFSGSEVALGVGLFAWMVFYAAGGLWLGSYADRVSNPRKAFYAFLSLAVVLSGMGLFTSFHFRQIFGYVGGETLPLYLSVPASVMISAPCVLFGLLFALAPRVVERGKSIARAYAVEAIGSASGALFLLFLQLGGIGPVGSFIALSCMSLAVMMPPVAGIFTCVAVLPLIWMVDLDLLYLDLTSRTGRVLTRVSSPYGEIVAVRHGQQITVFENEMPVGAVGDKAPREFIVLVADGLSPQGPVLIISPDVTTACMMAEDMGREVHVVWWDEEVISVQKRFIKNCKGKIYFHFTDPVTFLKQNNLNYSCLMLFAGIPANLSSSRFYSLEFFQTVRERLKEKGIFIISGGVVTEALSPPQIRFFSLLFSTLEAAGFESRVYPVGSFLFISSAYPAAISLDVGKVKTMLERKGVDYKFASPEVVGYSLSPQRVAFYNGILKREAADMSPSRASLPTAFVYASAFLAEISHPGSFYFFSRWYEFKWWWAVSVMVIVVAFVIAFFSRGIPKAGAVFASGFNSMVFVVFAFAFFQAVHGTVYLKVSLINTLFFAGLFAGSVLRVEMRMGFTPLFIIFSGACGLFLLLFAAGVYLWWKIPQCFFYAGVFIVAFTSSSVFRSASLKENFPVGRWAGVLDFADHTGSAIGALSSSILFLPLFGAFSGPVAAVFVSVVWLCLWALLSRRPGS